MTPLEEVIIDKIKNEGRITFRSFMEMALYYPELGYYSSPETTIGKKGDFYTSPHLHPIFGAMIAKCFLEMWILLGKPSDFVAVEMGAGIGYLCKDIIDYLHKSSKDPVLPEELNDFLKSFRYVIVEPYQHFQEKQKELLNDNANRNITWVNSLNEISNITGCIFSNELLDAFPVHLIEMDEDLKELYLNHDGQGFIEEKGAISTTNITDYIKDFGISLPAGYKTEINLQVKEWLKEASSVLSRGFILTIDYGYTTREYYDEDRSNGTLLCYHKHQLNEDPYKHIGYQDITAHINFSALKKWGGELGLKTTGYSPQGTFLTASGIDEVIMELYSDSPDYLLEISKIKGLIMPQGMGESHSVMAQYKGEGSPELRGFSMRNLAKHL